MTISLLLADCGFRVLLLEKSAVIGGSMQRFHRCGIPFDTGFHFTAALTGCMGDMVRMLKFSPGLETIPIRTNLYLADRKKLFHLPRGRSRVRDYFCSLYPAEAEKIRRYFETEKRIFENTPLFNLREDGFAMSGIQQEDFLSLKTYLDSLGISGEVRSLLASFTSCHGTPCGEISLANHCRVSFGLLDDLVRVKGSGGAFVEAFRRRAAELGIRDPDALHDRRVHSFGASPLSQGSSDGWKHGFVLGLRHDDSSSCGGGTSAGAVPFGTLSGADPGNLRRGAAFSRCSAFWRGRVKRSVRS